MYTKEDFKSIKNALTAQLIGWIIFGIISLFSGIYYIDNVKYALITVWQYLTIPINIEIIWLLVIFLIGLFLPFGYSYVYENYIKDDFSSHTDFRRGNFFGVEWTWSYSGRSKDVYKDSLQPICPNCKGKLDMFGNPDDNETSFICMNTDCDFANLGDIHIVESSENVILNSISQEVDRILRQKELKL